MSAARHVHTIPVPLGATPEDAWAEITTLGKLAYPPENETECTWAVIECDGEECKSIEKAPNFRRYYNDVLIEGPPE